MNMFCKFYNNSLIESLVKEYCLDSFIEIRAQRHKLLYNEYWSDLRNYFDLLDARKVDVVTNSPKIIVGQRSDLEDQQFLIMKSILHRLIPWRKGPYQFFGVDIDSEWNCDLKVQRYLDKLDFKDKNILDIGCANGYYLMRLLDFKPKLLFGIDPSDRGFLCAHLIQNYLQTENYCHDMLGVEHLDMFEPIFDIVFFMGVLYHRRDPLLALKQVKDVCKKGAKVLIETLVHPGDHYECLIPKDRYCQMRNVYHVPTLSYLYKWLEETGFSNFNLIDVSKTSFEEQRPTEWMPFQSLQSFLDPNNPDLTIEGYPTPDRVMIIVEV